ncbi:sigma-70 family RNA polymerase sigma factor [Ktedonosporobacter rubrisoli]|uniref:RNA polymerase sigma factor n=1 Tax=Ktedonosporobacter rubrisoli TaxID=2509675 RepID=A0A4P6JV29_KTERU|nr:sigma-70 family RNA polymerase sigma factor [Ktedonosporobacter rubrisoli]QBD79255.1 sigma-70 family RNA polymerase sigma factor [Ktedonosporobacter rubrisoli]
MDDARSFPPDDQGEILDATKVGQQPEQPAVISNLEEVLATARPRLLRIARMQGVAPDAIDDVVQETLVEAWQHLDKLRTPERFHAWLDGICRNVCLRWSSTQKKYLLRRAILPDPFAEKLNGPGSSLEEDLPDPKALDPAEELSQQELPILLGQALDYLPGVTREIVELYYLAGIPQRVIAARLSLTLKALEVRLVRARRQLRHILSNQLRADAEAFGLILDQDTRGAIKPEKRYIGYFLVEGENNQMNSIDHFDRFTRESQVVIEMAQKEAQYFGHNALGSEHILLGLIHEGKSVAARVLVGLGITLEKVRQAVEEAKGRGTQSGSGEMGLTAHANIVIEMVMKEAERQFPARSTKPEERLIGSIYISEEAAEKILQEKKVPDDWKALGITLTQIRKAVSEARGRGVELLYDQTSATNTPTKQSKRRSHPLFSITTENLLLGLIKVPECTAVKILQELGAPLKDFGSLVFLERATTLQIARQEYTQKFTRQARKAWELAHEESRRLQDSFVGAGHLLLGLVAEGSGAAATALAEMGVELSQIREKVKPDYQAGNWNVAGSIKLQPRLKHIIVLASNEARRYNHHSLGTGHLLLALLRDEGMATGYLELLGVDLDKLRIALGNVQSEELSSPEQGREEVADPISGEGVYAYDASISSIERGLQSRELDKIMLAIYPFTLEARSVLENARSAAQSSAQVGPEHLLLALVSLTFSHEGPVSKVFKGLGIAYARVQAAVEDRLGWGVKMATVVLVHSAQCRACLLLAADEAERRDGSGAPIKSEHLLLGLLREEKGIVADLLGDIGTSVREVRTNLLEALGDASPEGTSESEN